MAPSISPSTRSVFIWSSASLLADLAHGKTDMDQHPVAGQRACRPAAGQDQSCAARRPHQPAPTPHCRRRFRRSFLVWLGTCDILPVGRWSLVPWSLAKSIASECALFVLLTSHRIHSAFGQRPRAKDQRRLSSLPRDNVERELQLVLQLHRASSSGHGPDSVITLPNGEFSGSPQRVAFQRDSRRNRLAQRYPMQGQLPIQVPP